MKKTTKPFHRITETRAKLEMFSEYGDAVFKDDAERTQMLHDAHFAVSALMDFRNIINGMVGFSEMPKEAARYYIDD